MSNARGRRSWPRHAPMVWCLSSRFRRATREPESMWLLLIPIVIVAAVMFAILGTVFAGVFWLIGGIWPWLLIGLGLWPVWRQEGRHRRLARAPGGAGRGDQPAQGAYAPTRASPA